ISPHLEIADRNACREHEVRSHIRAGKPPEHRLARERLVVPEAAHLWIRVPIDQQVDIARFDQPQRCLLTANRTRTVEAASLKLAHDVCCSARMTRFTPTNDEHACLVCRLHYEFAGSSFNEECSEDAKGLQ